MDLLRDYALSFVGVPYRWAGSNPIDGYDCSGFVQELLASVGVDPVGDQTAQELFNRFETAGEWNSYKLGALAFYGASATKVTHVAMLLDQYRVIEAGGGNGSTRTLEDAAEQNAFVRIRHLNYRKDLVAVIRPRLSTVGVI